MPHILVKKSFYDSGWSSVDNPYGPGGYAYDGPPIPEPEPKPRGPSEQLTLPYFDPQLDYRTGWKGVEPVTAIRYMGDYEAGTPVEQDDMNVHFEHGGAGGLMPRRSPNVDFKAPTVDAPHGAPAPAGWKNRPPTDKDADHGYPDDGGWLYRDPDNGQHYWYKNGTKHFMDVDMGTMGSWWSRPTMEDLYNATGQEQSPTKLVMIRGDPKRWGRAHTRDSDEQQIENVAEMFLEHDKKIPKSHLVEVPLGRDEMGRRLNHRHAAQDMGLPSSGRNPWAIDPENRASRWSSTEPIQWEPPRKAGEKRKQTVEEKINQQLRDLGWDEADLKGHPMEIAFQLLKARTKMNSEHRLPDNEYSPKALKDFLQSGALDGEQLMPVRTDPHFHDQMVSRGLLDWRKHRGRNQQIVSGEGNTFMPKGGFAGMHPHEYINSLASVFMHRHGISHPSQLPGGRIGLHFADRGEDTFTDRTKMHTNIGTQIIGGYTAMLEQDRFNPDGMALVTLYDEADKWHAKMGNRMEGRTYSLFDDEPHMGQKFNSPPLGDPLYEMGGREEEVKQVNTHEIPAQAKEWFDNHFQTDEHLHNGKPMFKLTKPRGESGYRLDWNGGKLQSGWNNQMPHYASVIGHAANTLYQDASLGMEPDAAHGLATDMFNTWSDIHNQQGARAFDFNNAYSQLPEGTPGIDYDMLKGDVMSMVFRLLKERKSPEAWANKRRYDSEYQKTPKRVKYREQLNAERRRRGIYGKGGKDVSHTQGGKLTLENPSTNRARHFKGKGTLRRVKVR